MKRNRNFDRGFYKAVSAFGRFLDNKQVIGAISLFAFICTIPTLVEGGGFLQLLTMIVDPFLICLALRNIDYDTDDDTTNGEV